MIDIAIVPDSFAAVGVGAMGSVGCHQSLLLPNDFPSLEVSK